MCSCEEGKVQGETNVSCSGLGVRNEGLEMMWELSAFWVCLLEEVSQVCLLEKVSLAQSVRPLETCSPVLLGHSVAKGF